MLKKKKKNLQQRPETHAAQSLKYLLSGLLQKKILNLPLHFAEEQMQRPPELPSITLLTTGVAGMEYRFPDSWPNTWERPACI